MKVPRFHKGFFFILFIIMACTISGKVFAAMDPVEVQQRNEKAPYQVVGEVTSDELFQDITKDKNHPLQIRKMTIQISEVLKAPPGLEGSNTVEVYYDYIPTWNAGEYVGGARVDIAIGDVITVWLTEGDYGWEPVLSGNSVQHITYNEERMNHISEPFWHMVTRWVGNLGSTKTDILVLFSLITVLAWAFYRGIRKMA